MQCDTCGNTYDKAFRVTTHDGQVLAFDSFECAIHRLAPRCAHCDCRVIGHGVQGDGQQVFCCDHCAQSKMST
jgi:hypothetical protein